MRATATDVSTVPKKAARRRSSSRERRRAIEDWILLAPQLTLFFLLTLLPLILAVPVLLTDMSGFNDPEVHYVGLQNFTELFTNPTLAGDYWPALSRTVRFTIMNYAMVYVFGLTLALLMYEVGMQGGAFTVIYMPWMISGLAIGFIALLLFSQSTGSVNLILKALGWIEKGFSIKTEAGTTIILPIVVGWRAAGFNMAIFLTGLLSIPVETVEASIVDGASYFQRLRRVYFPQMIPSFIIATVFCMFGSFRVFAELVAMGGLYANEAAEFLSIVFIRYGFSRNRMALSMTLSIQTFLPLMILGLLLQRLQKRLSYEV